jgi:RNA polymerase Rpb2, domain 6
MNVVRNNRLEEIPDDDTDVDFELLTPAQQYGSHTNMIPLASAVQAPRLFYGGRFANQALAIENGEAPLVQNLDTSDPEGRSFDELVGEKLGAVRAGRHGRVIAVTPDYIRVVYEDGETDDVGLYNHQPFNQKSGVHSRALLKKGDTFTPGQMMAASSYTDDNGVQNMGLNARIGLVPWKGYSMDDAMPISESFAKRLSAIQYKVVHQDQSDNLKTGLSHYRALFPSRFTKEKLQNFDDDGMVRPGTILEPGDPIILATMPRTLSSAGANIGRLSKALRQQRRDASQVWHGHQPAEVIAARRTKNGHKVVLRFVKPTDVGDKIVLRQGAKATVSKIIPDDQMPRTEDGQPLDAMLNPLSLVSRANPASQHEIRLGKVAKKLGHALKLPSYLPKGQTWNSFIDQMEQENGVQSQEMIFDPEENRLLSAPVTVGYGFVNKLHHTSECYDEVTEVLTDSGWKRWRDVIESDKLATSDPRGQTLRFERPLHLMRYHYEGDLYCFEGRYVDYAVTPNHSMWQKPYYGQREFSMQQASELHGRRFKVIQFGLEPETMDDRESIPIGNKEFAWCDFCEFVGWWVTEGCVGSNRVSVLVYQSSVANPGKFLRIEKLLNRLGVAWSHYNSDGVKKGFVINEKSWATLFSKYGSHCQYKRVPREVLDGGLDGMRRAIESMMLGDGSTSNTPTGASSRFATTSPGLADDFQEMCVRVGWGSIIRPVPRDSKKYRDNPHYLDSWHLSFTKIRKASQVDGDRNEGGFALRPYSGMVYCAEMRSGLLYVRRNGKPLLCGNSKTSARGTGSYDQNEQPARGGGEMAQAKRFSGLENFATLSSGAYALMRENSTIRGQKNHDFWKALRTGRTLPKVGEPFVWHKFRALLTGAGINTRETGRGKYRLAPFTDNDLDEREPVDVENGEMVNLRDLQPIAGGLFDSRLLNGEKWGRIRLPRPILNPAMEDTARVMLGLTKQQLEDVLAGRVALSDVMQK